MTICGLWNIEIPQQSARFVGHDRRNAAAGDPLTPDVTAQKSSVSNSPQSVAVIQPETVAG
jgi:hypothetical protein